MEQTEEIRYPIKNLYIGMLGRIYDDGTFISRGIKNPIIFAYKIKERGIAWHGIPLFVNTYYKDIFTDNVYSYIDNIYYPDPTAKGKIVFKGFLLCNQLSVEERAKGYFTHEEAVKYLREMNAMYEENSEVNNELSTKTEIALENAKKIVDRKKTKIKGFLKSFNWNR